MQYTPKQPKKQAPPPNPPQAADLTPSEFIRIAATLQAGQRRAANAAPTIHRLRAVVGGL